MVQLNFLAGCRRDLRNTGNFHKLIRWCRCNLGLVVVDERVARICVYFSHRDYDGLHATFFCSLNSKLLVVGEYLGKHKVLTALSLALGIFCVPALVSAALDIIMEFSSSSAIIFEAPGFLRIYEDGKVERLVDRETVPPSSEDDNFDEEKEGVASKDVVLDPQTGVFVRLYLPRLEVIDGKGKVPVLLYFHGGGFCIGSVASAVYHSYLNKVAAEAKVICVSVDYRRAPEHRLPAAYDDCFGALEWLDRQAMALDGVSVDPWLASHADFSNVFLAGDSAGANILHQVGIRAGERKWDGVRLQGAVLVHPFFGGEERIGCELEADAEVDGFNVMTDAIWSISLPVGADKDHPFRNPVGPRSPALSTLVYPRTLVFVAGKDLLRARGIWYFQSLKKAGKEVDLVTTEDEIHVFHLFNQKSENTLLMLKRISDFMHSSAIHSGPLRQL